MKLLKEDRVSSAEYKGRTDFLNGKPLVKTMYYVAKPDGSRDADRSRELNKAYVRGWQSEAGKRR